MATSNLTIDQNLKWIQETDPNVVCPYLDSPEVVLVPCIPHPPSGTFIPLYTMATFSLSRQAPPPPVPKLANPINRGGLKHKPWTECEDKLLKELVEVRGLKKWLLIAENLNAEIHHGEIARKGKHCRERWYNHLDPTLNSKSYVEGEWSYEEDIRLLKQQASIGKKWSKLASLMPGRTENAVKNRYNSLIRKAKAAYNMQLFPDESVAFYLIQEFEARRSGA